MTDATAQIYDSPSKAAAKAVAEPVVELAGVTLTLDAASGPVEILRGVDLRINRAEAVAIVGPSGSGKSSLISVAAGLERPTSGDVRLMGTSLAGLNEDTLARLRRGRVSLVFQAFHLLATMTAFDNVRATLEICGRDRVDERARETLEAVGLGHRLTHYPGQLSGGEQQRVAVARALASDPALVFADEPTGNLDSATGASVADMLFRLSAERGVTLVLVTHDPDLASRADRIVRMHDGRIV